MTKYICRLSLPPLLHCYTPHAQESGDNSQSSMQQSSTGDVNMREMGQGPLIDRLKGAAQKSKQAVEQHKAGGGGGGQV